MEVQIKCLDKFKPLITKKKRFKILVGGRASTKSTFVADAMAVFMASGALVCGAREYQNSIAESVHRLIEDEIERLKLPGFNSNNTSITHYSGGRSFYVGLARNITSLKSTLTGVKYLWIEEGEALTERTLRVLTGSVRNSAKDAEDAEELGEALEVPEIWITLNRNSRKDPIAKKFLARAEKQLAATGYYEDDNMIIVEANYTDMPRKWFLQSGLESERADDEENLSQAEYLHKWHGHYLETVDNTIILPDWFDSCVDAHKKLGFKPEGVEVVSHDCADSSDARSYCYRHGSVIKQVKENYKLDVNDACDWATDFANKIKADLFVWDGDGMGTALRAQVAAAFDGKHTQFQMFKGSNAPLWPDQIYERVGQELGKPKTNKETFFNARAQMYWMLRDRMYKTHRAVTRGDYYNPDELISFSSEMDELDDLKAEICRIPRKKNGNGKYQLMSKDEMKTNDIESPNMADAVAMSLPVEIAHEKKIRRKPKNYDIPQAFSHFS